MADSRTPRQRELDALAELPSAVSYVPVSESGVLLSDVIQQYVKLYKLIDPYNPENLKPAAYELAVGETYSIGGKTHRLSNATGERELKIEPFEVAIIQTFERVNIPNFLIARWNIRVAWAYQGLMWVGGPQVDPGYKGFLACPIYNLSDKTVTLHFGEPLAVIDFVTTTTPKNYSKRYKRPEERTRLVFDDYNPTMRSALARFARERLDEFEARLDEMQVQNNERAQGMQARIDAFTVVTFTAFAILVGAVAVVATKSPPGFGWNPTLILSAVAVLLSLLCTYFIKAEVAVSKKVPWVQFGTIFVVAISAYALLDLFAFSPPSRELVRLQSQLHDVRQEVHDLKKRLHIQ